MIQAPPGFNDVALAAESYIEFERGQWIVYLDVIFWTETVRRRIQSYPTRRQAEIAASWIKRTAQRTLPHAPTGEVSF